MDTLTDQNWLLSVGVFLPLLGCLFVYCGATRMDERGGCTIASGLDRLAIGQRLCQAFETYRSLSGDPATLAGLCLDAHRRFQDGAGSGVDIMTALHGGVIGVRPGTGELPDVERFAWPCPPDAEVELEVIDSGGNTCPGSPAQSVAMAATARHRPCCSKGPGRIGRPRDNPP